MKYTLLLFLTLASYALGFGQTIPAERTVNWKQAGIRSPFASTVKTIDFKAAGGYTDGKTANDQVYDKVLKSLGNGITVIYFPKGTYYFTSPLSLGSNVILRGESNELTSLVFQLKAADQLIKIQGSKTNTESKLSADAGKDASNINVANPEQFASGDYVRISDNDAALVTSDWSKGYTGQIVMIDHISGKTVYLSSSLRRAYTTGNSAKITKLNMVEHAGIETLKIERKDKTTSQTSNIQFNYAANCDVKCIESYNCNFAHIELSNSTNIEVTGSYMHHAFSYGGGGEGYGIATQYTSGECLVANNTFNHLRHAMLLQAGANGNVYAYNYSTDPTWTGESLPSDAAGDIVLHGNYPYANLFEGNVVQNIVIDNSHGANGPYNTFFRDRALSYGIVMSSGSGDNQNFEGNEITNTSFLKGNYMLLGSGHYQYGNNRNGTTLPAGTSNLTTASLYYSDKPAYAPATWPPIGLPNKLNANTITALDRYSKSNYTACSYTPQSPADTTKPRDTTSHAIDTTRKDTTTPKDTTVVRDTTTTRDTVTASINPGIGTSKTKLNLYPNPMRDYLNIAIEGNSPNTIREITILTQDGKVASHYGATNHIDTGTLPEGIYILMIRLSNNEMVMARVMKGK